MGRQVSGDFLSSFVCPDGCEPLGGEKECAGDAGVPSTKVRELSATVVWETEETAVVNEEGTEEDGTEDEDDEEEGEESNGGVSEGEGGEEGGVTIA